jgi:hypothetical protein
LGELGDHREAQFLVVITDLVVLDAALTRLAEVDSEQSKLVDLRYLTGPRLRKIKNKWAVSAALCAVSSERTSCVEETTMKLNRSFAKVLAVVAIAFMISSAAQAQPGEWGRDGCLYAPARGGQWSRQGCVLQYGSGRYYRNDATHVITDLSTNFSYLTGRDGRLLIWTSTGWMDAQVYVEQVRASRPTPDQPIQTLKAGEIALGVRENIPQNSLDMTPEEKAWVQRSNGQWIGKLQTGTLQTHCENGGGLNGSRNYPDLLGPQQKQCTYP